MNHTDPSKRHDFVMLFDVTAGNPNGDPDAGNLPRVDPETNHGIITDVALKRKVRDYLIATHGVPIFIQTKTALNTLILRAFRDTGWAPPHALVTDEDVLEWVEGLPEAFELSDSTDGAAEGKNVVYVGESTRERDIRSALMEGLDEQEEAGDLRPKLTQLARALSGQRTSRPTRPQQESARDDLCRDYYDIRMFGAVLGTGLNAGQVRGPMQLTFARSVDPIHPLDLTITRQARTTSARMETGTTEMGRKAIVPYGLYVAHGFYNPFLAEQTHVTESDLELFWDAVQNMFTFDRSAARGEMAMRGVYVFSHESGLGNAPSHKLFEKIRVNRIEGIESPRNFHDYGVEVDEAELPDNVSLEKVCEG
jgi:CRISPR-associated protein Csd2